MPLPIAKTTTEAEAEIAIIDISYHRGKRREHKRIRTNTPHRF
jgi:hypothetical protein